MSWIYGALGFSRSGFHVWLSRAPSERARRDEALGATVRASFLNSYRTYGARRVWHDLLAEGLSCGLHRVERLMRQQALKARPRRRGLPRDNGERSVITGKILDRQFTADAPNRKWVADFTYIWTAEGWLQVAAVIDLFSGRVVGWSMRQTLHTEIALDALNMAVERQRPAPGLIHHSDRGIQYAAEAYRSALARSGITPSMSRKGDCWHNAPMESFFHTLKTERVHHRVYATRDQARRDLFGYIEGFYNPRRLHSPLGYISPAEAERRAA